jgi:hypothetical protein
MLIPKQILLLALLPSIVHTSTEKISISKRCESIHRQKYLTLRLKRVIGLLRLMPAQTTRNLLHIDPTEFRHPMIIDTVTNIQKQHSLDPLFASWESLAGFQHVDDPLFSREFTELIFVIQRQLVQRSGESNANMFPSMSGIDALLTLEETTYTEAMATRYYYAKRIEKSMNALKNIRCGRQIFFEKDGDGRFTPTRFHAFEHPEIQHCIEQMDHQNSLAPLLWLFDSFEKMKCLQDEQFLKEFLLLSLAIQYNIGMHSSGTKGALREKTIQEASNIYRANLNKLPIEEILGAINKIGEELPPLIEQYDLTNSNLTWRQVWQKHRWSIIGQAAMAGVNIGIFLLQNRK